MKYIRYKGEFISVAGTVWRAEILQEADAAFSAVGALEFDADQPLVIEWGNKSKEEVICGSVATLKIISPGDRTYEDLYSIDVGRVRLDVYKDNKLYWSGTIDTEFYEEPYEQAEGYTVTLTFSDFGVMDRLKYDRAGMLTLADVVSYALSRSGINYGGVDDSLISTAIADGEAAISLSDLKVRSDNFYDEDGEASTLADVITGILQPLALRMVQRGGKVYVYDINGLYHSAAAKQITWDGASQEMGVDTVYNNAKITWNTYAQSGNIAPDSCWPDSIKTDAKLTALNNLNGGVKGSARYFSYHYSTDIWDWIDATDCGFTLWITKDGNNAELVNAGANFFRIVPQYDGDESEGIAIYFRAVQGIKVGSSSNWRANYGSQPYGVTTIPGDSTSALTNVGGVIFKSSPVWLPPVDNTSDLLLRVRMDLLMDPRFNPYESAANLMTYVEQKDWYDQFKTYGNFIYIPVTIKYQPDGSDKVYVWTNQTEVKQPVNNPITTLYGTYGRWVEYTSDSNPNAWGYLCYYDAKDRKDTSGVLGWKTNRPAINPHTKETISILTNADPGQYIPYPDQGGEGGRFWVEVRDDGWLIIDDGKDLTAAENGKKSIWQRVSWVLAKLPEIEIMNHSQFDQTINTDDVEYNAEINSAAKEAIEIDTICGTSADGIPTARGAYFNAATGKQIRTLSRAGRTSQVEDLLIGTLYSQFAQRRTTLSGETVLAADPIATYTEANQGAKKFMIVEEIQDTRLACSETTYVEIRPDEYKRNNE